MVRMIRVRRRVGNKFISYLTVDKGKPGKTPKVKRWAVFSSTLYGWRKDASEAERHRSILVSVKREGVNATKSKLLQLANVTTDPETHKKARADFEWLRRLYPPKSK